MVSTSCSQVGQAGSRSQTGASMLTEVGDDWNVYSADSSSLRVLHGVRKQFTQGSASRRLDSV